MGYNKYRKLENIILRSSWNWPLHEEEICKFTFFLFMLTENC